MAWFLYAAFTTKGQDSLIVIFAFPAFVISALSLWPGWLEIHIDGSSMQTAGIVRVVCLVVVLVMNAIGRAYTQYSAVGACVFGVTAWLDFSLKM